MTWPSDQGRGVYPEMQRFYRINLTALSWGEIYRAAGNAFTFIIALPFVGVMKLFRIPLKLGERMPREVSFQPVDQVAYSRCAPRVDPLLEATKALGFEHFTTFRVPEMPFDSVVFTLMNRSENAYAAIYHVTSPAGSKASIPAGYSSSAPGRSRYTNPAAPGSNSWCA